MELFIDLLKLIVAGLIGALTPILIARYQKTKEERDSGLVRDYITIADMTGAQLERKINRIDNLEKEIEAIKEARRLREIELAKERDELNARIKSELIDSKQIRADNVKLQKRVIELEAESASKEQHMVKMENTVLTLAKYVNALDKGEPLPKLNGLLESVEKMKLAREERERLKGGK
jgi:hypothetical protein